MHFCFGHLQPVASKTCSLWKVYEIVLVFVLLILCSIPSLSIWRCFLLVYFQTIFHNAWHYRALSIWGCFLFFSYTFGLLSMGSYLYFSNSAWLCGADLLLVLLKHSGASVGFSWIQLTVCSGGSQPLVIINECSFFLFFSFWLGLWCLAGTCHFANLLQPFRNSFLHPLLKTALFFLVRWYWIFCYNLDVPLEHLSEFHPIWACEGCDFLRLIFNKLFA